MLEGKIRVRSLIIGFVICAGFFRIQGALASLPLQPSAPQFYHQLLCQRLIQHPHFLGFGKHFPEEAPDLKIQFPQNWTRPDTRPLIDIELTAITSQNPTLRWQADARAAQYWAYKKPELGFDAAMAHLFKLPTHPDAMSSVFLALPDLPAFSAQESGDQWIRENGIFVLKALNLDNKDSQSIQNAFHRAYVTYLALDLLSQIAPGVLFQHKPLFDVSQIHWHRIFTAKTAVFEQDYFYGPTAAQLQDALTADQVHFGLPAPVPVDEFLKQYGLTASDLAALKPQLTALEIFYQRADEWADQTPKIGSMHSGAYRRFNSKIHPVYFDLNHGSNLIYDVRKRRFVVIDA